MAKPFTWEFDVRSYELDTFGHVNNAVYQNYLEESATRASASVGYPYHWFFEHQKAWVVRKMSIRYVSPLHYGDRVRLSTWISESHRVYAHREYDMRRVEDDSAVLRARARWVYVDLQTMRPIRIPDEFDSIFEPTNDLEDLKVRLKNPRTFPDSPLYISTRRVQRYELDPAEVVNNAVYLNWFEQAMFDAFAQAGWPVERMQSVGLGMVQAAHEIDYLRPARNGAVLRIESRATELTRTRGAWQHRILNAESGDTLATDYSVGAFVDLQTGKPCSLPEEILSALMQDGQAK